MDTRNARIADADHSDRGDVTRRWIDAYAHHVRQRFNSRALVSVRIDGGPPTELAFIYALAGGGLVLTLPVEPSEHDDRGEHHEHDDHAGHHEHDDHAGHHKHDDHGQRDETTGTDGHGHGGAGHRLLDGELGTGQAEIWIAAPDQAIFEARRLETGVLCTGFGHLGVSRTPRLIIPRGTEPPPPRDHHGNEDF